MGRRGGHVGMDGCSRLRSRVATCAATNRGTAVFAMLVRPKPPSLRGSLAWRSCGAVRGLILKQRVKDEAVAASNCSSRGADTEGDVLCIVWTRWLVAM